MKNKSRRYDINTSKYSENKKCLSMMMLTCTSQQISNI